MVRTTVSQHVTVRVDDDLHARVQIAVEHLNEFDDQSQFIRYCLREGLNTVDIDFDGYGGDYRRYKTGHRDP